MNITGVIIFLFSTAPQYKLFKFKEDIKDIKEIWKWIKHLIFNGGGTPIVVNSYVCYWIGLVLILLGNAIQLFLIIHKITNKIE